MKIIELTQNKTVTVDDSDYEFLIQWKWFAKKNRNTFYAVRKHTGRLVYMHRVILEIISKNVFVDHKDQNGLNNQRSNIRIATNSQNQANRPALKNKTSQYLGVCFYPFNKEKQWYAQIKKDRRIYNLGRHLTQEEAALAYNNKAIELHGEFAHLNIIP